MKLRVTTPLLLLTVSFTVLQGYAQTQSYASSNTAKQDIDLATVRGELQVLNNKVRDFYSKEATDSIMKLYGERFTVLPEYKPAIVDRKALQAFFIDWFKDVDGILYDKTIYKVETFSNYVLEIGTFSLEYSTTRKLANSYTGKYMIMWERNPATQLTLLAEAFGSDKNIGPADVPYANVTVKKGFTLEKNMLNGELIEKIEAGDKILVQAVEQGNGLARADGFTKDGIYMPHFGTILEGMEALRPYMQQIYRPEAKLYSKNTYREIFNIGEFVLLHGHFKGGWGDRVTGGKFEGNMLNLMKRNERGELLMHRQLANNDR